MLLISGMGRVFVTMVSFTLMALSVDPKFSLDMTITSVPRDSSSLLVHVSLSLSFISRRSFWQVLSTKFG